MKKLLILAFWPRKRGGLGACPQLLILLILLILSKNSLAAPLQWTCNWPDARPQTFSLYQGETATFEPTFRVNGQLATNVTIEAVWYQTNGMGNAWWKLDGATFAPSNDVGAAAYRFFVEAKTSDDILYRANGALRMLPSPGFTPNAIEPPIATLDFTNIKVLNQPWHDTDLSPATNYIDRATNDVAAASKEYTDTAAHAAFVDATNYTDTALDF